MCEFIHSYPIINIACMDEQIRIAAFKWLKRQSLFYDDVLPRKVLEDGFYYKNQCIYRLKTIPKFS